MTKSIQSWLSQKMRNQVAGGEVFLEDIERVNLDGTGWRMLDAEESEALSAGINGRYQNRRVVAFARRDDSDDVACIIVSEHEKTNCLIIVIHDYASRGWEVAGRFGQLKDWIDDIGASRLRGHNT